MIKKLLTTIAFTAVVTAPTQVFASSDGVSVKLGERLYNRTCIWCHGEEGKGDGVAAKDESYGVTPKAFVSTILTEEQIYLYAKHGGQYWGSANSDMPGWTTQFSDTELKSIARYINTKIKKTHDK